MILNKYFERMARDGFHQIIHWVGPGSHVSTVNLTMGYGGITASFYKSTPYETCLFVAGQDSDVVQRYANAQEAIDGHLEYVADLRDKLKP